MIKKRTWILLALAVAAVLAVGFTRPHEPDLDYLVRWATNDPLFGLDGASPEGLETAAAALRGSAQGFAAQLHEPAIAQTLYPAAWLSSLPELERARRAFLAQPTQASWMHYQTLLLASVDQATADFEAFANAAAMAVGANSGLYIFADGTTKGAEFRERVAEAKKIFVGHRVRARHAIACAKNEAWFGCGIATTPPPPAILAPELSLPGHEAKIKSIYQQANAYKNLKGEGIVALSQSACSPATPLFIEVFTEPDGSLVLAPLDDLRFWDHFATDLPNDPRSYQYQNVLNPYICQDGARVYARIATMLYLRDQLRQSSQTTPEAAALATRAVLAEADVAAYAASRGADQTLVRAWLQQSGYTERVLQSIARLDRRFADPAAQQTASITYLFLTRASPLATFLLTNPTVSKGPVSFVSATTTESRLLSYNKTLTGVVPDEVLIETINRTLNGHGN